MSGVMMALLASTAQVGVLELVASGKTSGGFATVYTSADGVNWSEKITTAPSSFNRIFSTPDLLLATTTESPNRNIFYSTNGDDWVDASGNYNYDLNAITYNENADGTIKAKWLVAGGKYLDAFIVDSEVGTESWNDTYLSNGNKLNAIYYSPSRDIYIAAGDAGVLFVSSTGTPGSWTKVNLPNTIDIKGLAYNPSSNNFVSVGTGGAILYNSGDPSNTSAWSIATLTPQPDLGTYAGYSLVLYSDADFAGYGTEQYTRDFAGNFDGTVYAADTLTYETATYNDEYTVEGVSDYSMTFTTNFSDTYLTQYDSDYDRTDYSGATYQATYFTDYAGAGIAYDGGAFDQNYTNDYTLSYVVEGGYVRDYVQTNTYDTDYTSAVSYTTRYSISEYTVSYNTVYNNETADFSPLGPIFVPDPYDTDYEGTTFTLANYDTDYTLASTYTNAYTSDGSSFLSIYSGPLDYDSTSYSIDYTTSYTETFTGPEQIFTEIFESPAGAYLSTYSLSYLREFTAPYFADYTGDYDTIYTGPAGSITYVADYLGNYQGGYNVTYTSGYEGQYQGPSVDSTDFNAVVCSSASNLMVAVGDNRVVVTSADGGVTWIDRSSDAAIQAIDPSANIVDVTYSASLNKFFAVTNDTLYPIIFSQDGITWTAPDLGSLETSELKSISAKSRVLL